MNKMPTREFIPMLMVIHYAPTPSMNPAAAATDLLNSEFSALQLVHQSADNMRGTAVHMRTLKLEDEELAPPNMELLRHFGHGITYEQALLVQDSRVATYLLFHYPKGETWADIGATMDLISGFTQALADSTNGLIWDDETRELYTPARWQKSRLALVQGDLADIRRHINIHCYRQGEYLRAVSLGMRKFGYPDIAISNFTMSQMQPMCETINLLAQAFIEQGLPPLGEFDLSAGTLMHPGLQNDDNSTTARLTLVAASAEPGDPDNEIIEIRFDRYPGNSVREQQNAFLGNGLVDN